MATTQPSSADQLLSHRGRDAQAERGWTQVIEIISDVYDEKTNPDGYINMGLAENRLMHKEMIEYINSNFCLTEHSLTYADGGYGSKELRKAFAMFLTKHLKAGRAITLDEVICFPGITPAIEGIATMIANPGDGILLGRPYYNSFLTDLGLRAKVKAVTISFDEVDPFSIQAVAKYEAALLQSEQAGVKIRGIILCSPHNPLGKCYPENVLIELLKLCQKHQIHLISDEVYALSVWENRDSPSATPFTSVLALDLAGIIDPNLVHVLWGVSKDFGANGLRMGCAVTMNEPMRVALIAHSLFTFPSGASDKIVTNLLSDTAFTETYIRENRSRLARAHVRVTDFLREKQTTFYTGCNAAFFIWADLRTTYLRNNGSDLKLSREDGDKVDTEIYQNLLHHRVFVGKGDVYGDDHGGWFRIVFSHPDDYLDKGLQKIWEVVKGK